VRSRGPVFLAFVAVGVLVGVLVNALLSGGSRAAPGTTAAATAVSTDVLAEVTAATAPQTDGSESPLQYRPGAGGVAIKPKLTAKAYLVLDADKGVVLIAHNDRTRRPIASLTKVMTAILVIQDGKLDKKIRVPKAATNVEPNKEGLIAGRWYKRKLLLYSALMVSANDSAAALAYAGGDGSIRRFYARMNKRARSLGMVDTVYRSASGLNDETNFSSARDQAVLARYALRNALFERIVRTHRKLVKWPPPTYAKEWINHNRMLTTYTGTYGVKTGYTSAAGGCLIVAVERGGHHLIGVVLDSLNIWKDMPSLMNAGFAIVGG
jgi:D-alanyl-D-alanine carboxypeptidase